MSPPNVVGTWHLLDFVVTASDGRAPRRPMGEDPHGLIIYGADGWMSAVLSRRDRASLGKGSMERAHRAPSASRAEAFNSYLSYAGRWRLDGAEVVHTLVMSMIPDIVGTEQRRTVDLQPDGTLVLHYTVQDRHGVDHRFVLSWSRPTD